MSTLMILRPRYIPQWGQARCIIVDSPHSGQLMTFGAVSASWERRLFRLVTEVLRLGTAMLSSLLRAGGARHVG